MLYVDDDLPNHPKLAAAAALVPKYGLPRVLAGYVAALAYARKHLTDGALTAHSLRILRPFCPPPIAHALADRRVGLWHRRGAGYQIHDFHDWNDKADTIKHKRELARERKRRQRMRGGGNGDGGVPRDVTGDAKNGHAGTITIASTSVTSPARVLSGTYGSKPLRGAKTITFRILTAIARATFAPEIDRVGLGSTEIAEWSARIKDEIARQSFAYPPPDRITAAMSAIVHARSRES